MRAFVVSLSTSLLFAAAIRTGPETGASLPNFEAADQDGKSHKFQELFGPKGAVLVVYRSADW